MIIRQATRSILLFNIIDHFKVGFVFITELRFCADQLSRCFDRKLNIILIHISFWLINSIFSVQLPHVLFNKRKQFSLKQNH
ncbi:PDZ domain protein [Trichinella spiralis]|uniref:PDZ domain protein n=1 Tax=Trichinella spiralis TaxID=6334 RepID=UPI0001EFCD1B|nr:PDZ domain protein [Trichinella spiralis]